MHGEEFNSCPRETWRNRSFRLLELGRPIQPIKNTFALASGASQKPKLCFAGPFNQREMRSARRRGASKTARGPLIIIVLLACLLNLGGRGGRVLLLGGEDYFLGSLAEDGVADSHFSARPTAERVS